MLLNSSSKKGTNFIYSYKIFQKIHFGKSLHYTKQCQQRKQNYALHSSNKNSLTNKNKGHYIASISNHIHNTKQQEEAN